MMALHHKGKRLALLVSHLVLRVSRANLRALRDFLVFHTWSP